MVAASIGFAVFSFYAPIQAAYFAHAEKITGARCRAAERFAVKSSQAE